MKSFDLRQLRYFALLADELHFRRAAERLNITQAPLSVAIQNLERSLGAQLFYRTQRRVVLTDAGRVFREHVAAILERVDRGVADVHAITVGDAGELRLGFTAAAALLPFFPRVVAEFRRAFPKVAVTLRDLSSARQIAALQNREIDVAFVRGRSEPAPVDVGFTKLLRDPLIVVMHHDHPLATKASLVIGDLRDMPLIFYPPKAGIGLYDQVLRACALDGFVPTIVQEALDPLTIVGLAAIGLGVAVVPAELRCIAVPGVVYRPLADKGAMTELFLASRAGEASILVATIRRMAQAAVAASRDGHSIPIAE